MSSLIFLGLSIITFIVTYGIMFTILPMILGVFFSTADDIGITDPEWQETYDETESTVQWLVPLVPTIGIFMLVLRVMMAASSRGRD